jgi:hypothetical protein
MKTIVFIDTNIFLDFYRAREPGLGLLAHIGNHHDRIITGSQVEMEFKKNRQSEVLRVLGGFKPPDWNTLTTPGFLSASKPQRAILKRRREIDVFSKSLRSKIEGVLRHPAIHDPVFRAAQQLFRHKGPLNLDRSNKARYSIRRLAWKRFILGYPPRKAGDTSTGDSINWEWIIECAVRSGKHVVVVSRDSDFGVRFGKDLILNDWLSEEFHSRVSRLRHIRLTDSLAEAFKEAAVPVSRKEAEEEQTLLAEIQALPSEAVQRPSTPGTVDLANLNRALQELFKTINSRPKAVKEPPPNQSESG